MTMDAPAEVTPVLAPTCWDEYVGQAEMKARLKLAIQAAIKAEEPIGHILLGGRAGCGKSTIARIVAQQMDEAFDEPTTLLEFTRPLSEKKLTEVLLLNVDPTGNDHVVIFLDEFHAYSKRCQEILYPVVHEGQFDVGWGAEACPNLSIIVATTEVNAIEKPLRDRFHIKPVFAEYTVDEMAQIVRGMASRVPLLDGERGLTLTDDEVHALAVASGGSPRRVNMLVSTAAELVITDQDVDITRLFDLCQVEADGLTREHVQYLRVLWDNRGTAGLQQLSARLELPIPEVRSIEKMLSDRGMVVATAQGRQLTIAGRTRIR